MRLLGFRKSNKGMSLVELLVAMGIFVAAIVPMLYAFVYSSGYSFKSQQTMQATGISQAIIEQCKAANTNYDSLVASLTSGDILKENNSFTFTGTPSVSGNTFTFTNVKATLYDRSAVNDSVDAGSSNRRGYNVVVTLSPVTDAITDFSIIHPMRAEVTANYVLADALRTNDQAAQGIIYNRLRQTIIDNTVCTPAISDVQRETLAQSLFVDSLDRQKIFITRRITITAINTGVKLKVEYFYDGYGDSGSHPVAFSDTATTNIGGTTHTLSVNVTVPVDPDPSDATTYEEDILDGFPASSVFFYYFPAYPATNGLDNVAGTSDDTCNFSDAFVLENNMTTSYAIGGTPSERLDFYLFKQNSNDADNTNDVMYRDSDIETLEESYKCQIDMDTTASFPTNLYHNLLWNAATGSQLPGASSPTVNAASNCYNRTTPIYYDSGHASRVPVPGDPVSDYYDEFFYNINGSEILEDKAVFPYWNEKISGVGAITYYDARFIVTVDVYSNSTSDLIETMSAEFLNW